MESQDLEGLSQELKSVSTGGKELLQNLDEWWNDEGVKDLEIFIDPDLYQYIEKIYTESVRLAKRCAGLDEWVDKLDGWQR